MLKLGLRKKFEVFTSLNRRGLMLGRGRRLEDTIEKEGKTLFFLPQLFFIGIIL